MACTCLGVIAGCAGLPDTTGPHEEYYIRIPGKCSVMTTSMKF
jgi:hypothetical protein